MDSACAEIIKLAEKVMDGGEITEEEAKKLIRTKDEDTMLLLAMADKIRQKFNGNAVDFCAIINARSGHCQENCKFCAQSGWYHTGAKVYRLLPEDEILEAAKKAKAAGAVRFSLVTSGRNQDNPNEFEEIIDIVKKIREQVGIEVCCSLGLITKEQAIRLKEAGITRIHCNIETAPSYFPEVCSTHSMEDKEVIIRTLDIGADKQIGYFNLPKEDNPAMGMRALRICLTRPEIFKTQLRALFRASAFGKLGIMFPMVTSVWEVREAKRMCEEVRRELKNEGIPYSEDVQIGIMIETPAAAINSDRLAKEVDFFSIGTNDLTQYTLACDRQNNDLGRFYDPHHPAVLRLIRLVTENAHKNGIWVGICGELGADLTLTETFLAFGVDELSVTPRSVLPLRNAVRMTDTRESSERILSDLDSDYTAR